MFICPPKVGLPCGNPTTNDNSNNNNDNKQNQVFSDFAAAENGEWWVEYFKILWLRLVVGGVFSDFVASGSGG